MTYGAGSLARAFFSRTIKRRLVAKEAALVSPNANGGPRFNLEFLQDVLHVFLHRARAAPENFSDLAVAFAGGDPFHDFELACSQGARPFGIVGRGLVNSGRSAVPGGHGSVLLTERAFTVHTHNG